MAGPVDHHFLVDGVLFFIEESKSFHSRKVKVDLEFFCSDASVLDGFILCLDEVDDLVAHVRATTVVEQVIDYALDDGLGLRAKVSCVNDSYR